MTIHECTDPNCNFAETGECTSYVGKELTIENIKDILLETSDDDEEIDIDDERSITSLSIDDNESDNYVRLHYTGEAFNEDELIKFCLKSKPKIIAIVGDTGSGKSTLIQCIYEKYQRGGFHDKLFHGSFTLIGLDKRSHTARLASNNVTPTTPRTSISDGVQYFHLSFIKDNKENNLIISDRAGESYSQCCDDPKLISNFQEIGLADEIVILLDGSKIVTPLLRAEAISSVRKTIKLICDNIKKYNSEQASINLCVSKHDLIEGVTNSVEIIKCLNSVFEKSSKYCKSKNVAFNHFFISSRPENYSKEIAFGINELIDTWFLDKKNYIDNAFEHFVYTRQIEKFTC